MAKATGSTGIVVPTLDTVQAPRGYNAFAAPSTPAQAATLLATGADGTRGLLQEMLQAQHRVANNVARYGANSVRVANDTGWYDRTVTKVLACYAVLATVRGNVGTTAQAQAKAVLASAQAVSGYGTAQAQTAAGKAAFVAAQATPKAPRANRKPQTAKAAPVARRPRKGNATGATAPQAAGNAPAA